MKDLKKMAKKERKDVLILVAAEVQDLCEFEPSIKTDGKSEKEIIAMLEEAYPELTPEDKLSKEAITVFEFLGLRKLEVAEEEEEVVEDVDVVEESSKNIKVEKNPKKDKKDKKDKKEEEEKSKKEGTISMAVFMDQAISEGGSFEEISAVIAKEYEDRGLPQKSTVGKLKGHLKFRLTQNKNWLTSRKLKMTDDGIQ